MIEFTDIDLRTDILAARYVKTETVEVVFAESAGELSSPEGPNRYQAGDALITGSTGTKWSVSRDRFDTKYDAVPPTDQNTNGRYKARPVPVLARQLPEAFTVARSSGGDVLQGEAGDWLLQYAPGDHGIAKNNRFARVYRKVV
jgi:hypothetical protein